MPHINRIRVNNVKYNFGTQFYDDFMMRFSGKNTIYDLANGGGKSVLMLLLMQNLLPNCTLDEKQPLEKLFRTNEGSTTIHSMIEWILSDAHINNEFKYMLTGFCARKARDTGEEKQKNTAEIEYFNYCIFYRKYNDNDIKNLPLSSNGERITYSGLKNYLKELDRRDYNLEVHIFERKGDYQRFISRYGLYGSHWEIIRGINKTEGHVRTYFETNYRTTRKVVEDLLIEEIIQKSFQNRYNSGDEQDGMARTLLDIKDKLLELSKKKEELQNYDHQMEILNSFSERVKGIRQIYIGMEDLELELSKAYNTIIREEEERKNERVSEADKRLAAINKKNELSRMVETAKVMKKSKELEEYKSELKKYDEMIDSQRKELDRLNDELIQRECGNDYLDYISYKAEYDKIKEMLDFAMKDKDSLMSELSILTAAWKQQSEARVSVIEKTVSNEEEILNQEKNAYKEYADKAEEQSNELAVLEFKLDEYRVKREKLSELISDVKNNAGILIPASAGEELKKITLRQNENEKKKTELEEQLLEITKKQQEYFYERQRIVQNGKQIESQIEWYKSGIEKYEILKEKADSICRVYNENDVNKLQNTIRSSIHEKTIKINDLKNNLEDMKISLKAKKSGKPFEEPKAVKVLLDYIERYHGEKAVSGLEYLKNKDKDVQDRLISKFPLLSYGVVVLKDFDEIVSDDRISQLGSSSYPIVVIKEDILEKEDFQTDTDNIFYISGTQRFMETPESREKNIKQLEKDISDETHNIERQSETLLVMEEDYQLICRYNIESEKWSQTYSDLEELKLELKKNESSLSRLKEDAHEWEMSVSKISESLETVKKEIADDSKQQEILKDIQTHYNELQSVDGNIEKLLSESDILKHDINTLKVRMEALDRQMKARAQKIDTLEEERTALDKIWIERYMPYYKEGSAPYTILTGEELKARLDGVLEAMEKEDSGLSDRQKLLQNYLESMDKAVQRIKYQGYGLEELRELYDNNSLVKTSSKTLNSIKADRNEVNSRLEQMIIREKELLSKCDKQEGNISNAIQVISEKYGYYEEEGINAEDMDIFISENVQLLAEYESQIKSSDEKLNILDKDINRYVMVRHDIENRMKIEGISARDVTEYFDRGIDIEDKCSEILKKHERFRNDVISRREDFIHEKQMLIDTMKNIGGEALAEEIRINVGMPADYAETDSLMDMFAETVECLKLERDMVGRGIEDMEKIKENFESQCIQNCLNIKTELERFPKLSRIIMDGETIPIISLKIPYKSEDEYIGKMEQYIDEIAHNADELKTMDERMKYIKNQLSWKKLFSVIVTDMNGIKLNLYKRERIKEQSRYLPYEEAVGSTGQSQGIYIQFLISIINYISSINSQNSDASSLRKVVFLDNPFGAAKDVYIWEPIFKLLKTNNVQLIVPARGATPAITGRFDVNYVLGQKMTGKRQQTVVTDYFSNVENEEIEYTKMSYEQTSLFS
ncbi:MAG: hypothetical protein K2I03_07070 [Lachnospiraceae bacterium]|nr:hypothetical protein [Lachnospiraceae bacterium]